MDVSPVGGTCSAFVIQSKAWPHPRLIFTSVSMRALLCASGRMTQEVILPCRKLLCLCWSQVHAGTTPSVPGWGFLIGQVTSGRDLYKWPDPHMSSQGAACTPYKQIGTDTKVKTLLGPHSLPYLYGPSYMLGPTVFYIYFFPP